MLIIKGIHLLFSHLPTSHTTVRAVPHTAVSCFLILRPASFRFHLAVDTLAIGYTIPAIRAR